jgi:hypothetical protein
LKPYQREQSPGKQTGEGGDMVKGRNKEKMREKQSQRNPQVLSTAGCTGRLAMPIKGQNRNKSSKVYRKEIP